MSTIRLTVNGRDVVASVEPRTHLADFLRETLNLTGTHLGCEHGVCGACTLMVDGVPIRSCITLAIACDGAQITTIEGQDGDELMVALRAAFSREHALQCGFCTPGMLTSARDVILRMPSASTAAIRIAMSGNLCRCTGYNGIVRAIKCVIDERARNAYTSAPKADRPMGPAGSRLALSGLAVQAGADTTSRKETSAYRIWQTQDSTVAELEKFEPQTSLRQSFIVNQPRQEVWALFANLEEVVKCIPGASLNEPIQGGRMKLAMKVTVGPMAAEFDGVAHAIQDPQTYCGTISGVGADLRSRSTTRGKIHYRLSEESPDSTRVDVQLGFTLSGPLAQFNRSSILNDIAKRVCLMFAQNLERRVKSRASGGDAFEPPRPAQLNAGSLIVLAMWNRLKQILRTFLR